jgi:uncharacterized DUF497 family protein
MKVDFDPIKNERNIKERQLSFERAAEVDFNTALVFPDTRKAYGETRYIALCYLDGRLGSVNLIWPLCDGLIWPHPLSRG